MSRVLITGVGFVTGAATGGRAALAELLARPEDTRAPRVADDVLADLIEQDEARRLSRVCQLTVAAARIALADAGYDGAPGLGMVVGTEFGDLTSTIMFADGYLRGGPQGLSALLFPNTVMNTMSATAAIAVRARELALTLNAPTVAGELAVARAASLIRAGRVDAALAGGADEIGPLLGEVLGEMGAGDPRRGEGAAFVLLETETVAAARGARVLGEVASVASRALPARPHAVGRGVGSRAIAAALAEAGLPAAAVGRVFGSANGDGPRDRWEAAILDAALAPHRPPRVSLAKRVGRHAGVGPLTVAAAGLDRGVALVHGLARGGTQVALVVRSR